MEEDKGIDFAAGLSPTQKLVIDGKEYELAPLTLGGLGLIQKRAREVSLREAEENMSILRAAGDALDSEARTEMVREGMQTQSDWMFYLISAEGITFAFHLRLRDEHPEMTEERIAKSVTLEAIAAAREELTELLGVERFLSAGEGDASPPEKSTEELSVE